jgi:CheY-like chemotaxis protein
MEKPNVLYVDDEEINLEMLKITFQNEFEILTAISAEEGAGNFIPGCVSQ